MSGGEAIFGELSPGLIVILGALLVPVLSGRLRAAWMLALPFVAFAQTLGLEHGLHGTVSLFDFELTTLRVDRLSLLFGYVFLIALLICVIFQLHADGWLQQTAGLIYAGSAIGAVYAGDLVTLFLYWEGTAIASAFLIWARGSERALAAGTRYLIVQIGSGVLLLAGAIVHFGDTGSIAFESFDIASMAGLLIFLAFGIKAAFPLLHSWLQDAYPEATVSGTVILSCFTTKLAIYSLARGYAGTEILVPIGATMAAFPILYAIIEHDLRRVLTWGLNSQLGFMVVGVGIGTELALNGAVAHAAASIIYQALLFMAVGAVLFRTGSADAADLSGIAGEMPWTAAFYGIGAASISAFPLTAGFISKSMIIGAAGYEGLFWPWLVLLAASALTLVYAGLRVACAAFLGTAGTRPAAREAPASMLIAMGVAAALCIGIGVFPGPLYAMLPHGVDYHPYTLEHVVTQLQLLIFAALAFTVLMRTGFYPRERRSTNLDTDWLWRGAGRALARTVGAAARRGWQTLAMTVSVASRLVGHELLRQHGPAGALARTRPSGSMALWMTVLLAAFLVFSFF